MKLNNEIVLKLEKVGLAKENLYVDDQLQAP